MDNTIYIASVISDEVGPGSSPMVSNYLFSSLEKREEFISDWNAEQVELGYTKVRYDEYMSGGWVYTVERSHAELDRVYFNSTQYQQY